MCIRSNMAKGKPKPEVEAKDTVRLNLTISKELDDQFRKAVVRLQAEQA